MKIVNFLNINFHEFFENNFFDLLNPKNKILILLPSGPGLSSLLSDINYNNSLKNADFNLFDSGLFCLLLKLRGIVVKKYSGYRFIRDLLNFFKQNNINSYIFINPNKLQSITNNNFVNNNFISSKFEHYIAPKYNFNSPVDNKLLIYLNKIKPGFIIINLGGGIQEKLGSWLKENLDYDCVIVCSGAAISFHTKIQAPINDVIDKYYLGWLFRCINDPIIFVKRYFLALKLVYIFAANFLSIRVLQK